MVRCSQCGAEHPLADPVFVRPDALVALGHDERARHAVATDDLCEIALPGDAVRRFVRCVLPVVVSGFPPGVSWGVWAEVGADAFVRIRALWDEATQCEEPPFVGSLANDVPGYPPTAGLSLDVQLTGPSTRPIATFRGESAHPFVIECRRGVAFHRAAEWVGGQGAAGG